MGFENIEIIFNENIAVVTIKRPEVLNALNIETIKELGKAIDDLNENNQVRVIIITGSGSKSFVAGADIKEFIDLDPEGTWRLMKLGQNVFNKIYHSPRPVIAAINGYALGGGLELALACDILIAAETAIFGFPEINLGIFPGWGGTQSLSRLIGLKKAKEIIFTGRKISAKEAEKIGILNKVVDQEKLMEEAQKLAKEISDKSVLSIEFAKNAINMSDTTILKDGQDFEAQAISVCFTTKDHLEGVQAFLEKRLPIFNQ